MSKLSGRDCQREFCYQPVYKNFDYCAEHLDIKTKHPDDDGMSKVAARSREIESEALPALTNAVRELVETAKPKDYLDCENYPNSSTRCNNCFSCKHDSNKEFENGMNYGTDTYQANLLKAIGDKE